jgi:uncharacterized protein YdiU (UPF0061 family)
MLGVQHSFRQLPANFYSDVLPEPCRNPKIFIQNALFESLVTQGLPLDTAQLRDLVTGQKDWVGRGWLAQKYTGHQFGYYNPDLGDGRGMLAGDWCSPKGAYVELHLKGAGRTPYSRRGDGKAVLRSVIREALISEYMHGLGIATTRALAIATSDEWVFRHGPEPRATLLRLSQSHIRFGHFEYAATRPLSELSALSDYVIGRHFPELFNEPNPYAALLETVTRRTAQMIAHWQVQGFNHGVMNSDNMSILGETFDYGPYALMDLFNSRFICNDSDESGRYAFCNQPAIGLWNCERLALALSALTEQTDVKALQRVYAQAFNETYLTQFAAKLGLDIHEGFQDVTDFKGFLVDLLNWMEGEAIDYPRFFGLLTPCRQTLLERYPSSALWINAYTALLERFGQHAQQRMTQHNPRLYLRNGLIERVISSAYRGDFGPFEQLWQAAQRPFEIHPAIHGVDNAPENCELGVTCSCSS